MLNWLRRRLMRALIGKREFALELIKDEDGRLVGLGIEGLVSLRGGPLSFETPLRIVPAPYFDVVLGMKDEGNGPRT
jgi:hypothetical protein